MHLTINKGNNGFHLIELMISITILGILFSIAIPSYFSYIIKSHRLEAQTTLLKLATAMERYHIEHNSYLNVTLKSLHFSEMIAQGNYRLAIQNAKDNEFVLLAIPQNRQTQDTCGTLTLKNTSERGITDECW